MPGAVGEGVERADGGSHECGQLGRTWFGLHGWAAWAVSGEGTAVAFAEGAFEVAEAGCAAAGGRSADSTEPEALDGAGDEFAVEGLANQDGDIEIAEAVGTDDKAAMPEGVDGGTGDLVADRGVGSLNVAEAERCAEEANKKSGQGRDEGEGEALARGIGHGSEFSVWGLTSL